MDFNLKLKKCTSLKQVFDLVNEHYKTDEPLGVVSGSIVKGKIPEIIKLLNLKQK